VNLSKMKFIMTFRSIVFLILPEMVEVQLMRAGAVGRGGVTPATYRSAISKLSIFRRPTTRSIPTTRTIDRAINSSLKLTVNGGFIRVSKRTTEDSRVSSIIDSSIGNKTNNRVGNPDFNFGIKNIGNDGSVNHVMLLSNLS